MSEQTASKVPQIRFSGFEGDWVAKSLGDLIDLGSGRDYKHLSPGDIPVYGTGGYMLSVNEALSASANAVGIGRKGTIDKPYILRAPFWTVDTLFYAIPKSENYLDFVYCIFQRVNWKQRDESTGVPSLSKVAINGVSVLSTKPSEQTQIGKYFRELDSLIGLHQRKHDKLVTLKKAMLQKMFPQPGATTPEIRFKGFERDWGEKKLGEVGAFNPKEALPEIFEYVDLESVVGTEMVNHRTETRKTAPSRAQRLARQGDLFFQTVRPYQKNNYLFTLPFTNYVFSTGYAQIRPFDDGSFLLGLMQRDHFVKVVLDHCTGTSYPAINANVLAEIFVMVPTPKEQQKIGTYFRTLDELITQHATQLQKLQQIKSACLERMFV